MANNGMIIGKNIFALAFVALFVVSIPLAFAHVEEVNAGRHEETGLGHQFEEILPFHHFTEGHAFAGIMLVILWVSFFYTLYSIFQMLHKKKKK